MVRYINFLLFLFLSSVAFGQTGDLSLKVRKSNIRLGVGMIHTRTIDEGYTDSRLLFRGTNCKFSLAYGRETNRYIFNFTLAGSIGKVESKNGDLPSNYYLAQPSLEFLNHISDFKVFDKENSLFLGGLLSSFNQGIENEKVINNISIYSLHGIYLNVFDRLTLNEKQYVQLSYSMPVVVFENRLLWNGGASKYTWKDTENIAKLLTSNGEFSYFNLFGNVQLGIDYVVKTGRSTSFKFGYKFFSARSALEAPLHLYSNELIVELKIGL